MVRPVDNWSISGPMEMASASAMNVVIDNFKMAVQDGVWLSVASAMKLVRLSTAKLQAKV